jgi:hypothetical protein
VQSLFTTCQVIQLASLRLVCKDGIAIAPQLTPLGKSTVAKTSRVEGDSVHVPFYSRWRDADVPEGFHRLPAGWGMIPPPQTVTAAKNLESFFGPKRIPVSGSAAEILPQSFFLALADWAPLPQIMLFAVFLTAVTFAGFGFSFYPDSRLSPLGPVFWIWLGIAVVGISAALSAGNAITDAFSGCDRARPGAPGLFVRKTRSPHRAVPAPRSRSRARLAETPNYHRRGRGCG